MLYEELGTKLTFSINFHFQTNAKPKRTVQVLEDMMRVYVIDFGGYWNQFISLCEFLYNKIYHSSIDIALFKELYGRNCRSPIGWVEIGDIKTVGANLVGEAHEKVSYIKTKFLVS